MCMCKRSAYNSNFTDLCLQSPNLTLSLCYCSLCYYSLCLLPLTTDPSYCLNSNFLKRVDLNGLVIHYSAGKALILQNTSSYIILLLLYPRENKPTMYRTTITTSFRIIADIMTGCDIRGIVGIS